MKMIMEEYKLNSTQITIITRRLLADDSEFEGVWRAYKNKTNKLLGSEERFKELLRDLLA